MAWVRAGSAKLLLPALVGALGCCVAVEARTDGSGRPNMNGDYLLSPTPGAKPGKLPFPGRYADYPKRVTSFDVYSPPIKTLYSQVFWTKTANVPLPDDIVKQFDGKGMSVIGFEVDQVQRDPTGKMPDTSVPINVAYNHHFESTMLGKGAVMEKVSDISDPRYQALSGGHGQPDTDGVWVVSSDGRNTTADGSQQLPQYQAFGAANGGEYRKSFHGWAPGYAKTVLSPREFSITPMQIDTWQRDRMPRSSWHSGGPAGTPGRFVPGPVGRHSLAPTSGPDAIYSGLLECPLTSRIVKLVDSAAFVTLDGSGGTSQSDSCALHRSPGGGGGAGVAPKTSAECFHAAKQINFGRSSVSGFSARTGSFDDLPPGCSAVASPDGTGITVYFNTLAKTSVQCGGSGKLVTQGETKSLVDLKLHLDASTATATITIRGPSDVWFGVGFNASKMGDKPWAVTVEGASLQGRVTERQLGDQGGGGTQTVLPPSIVVVSNTVTSDGNRTVVLRRPFQASGKGIKPGSDPRYYTFDPHYDTALHFINAVGSTPEVAYHKDKTASFIAVLPADKQTPMCVCEGPPAPFGSASGSLMYTDTKTPGATAGTTIGFGNKCAPQPRSDLLAQRNPTCDIRTYVGGQIACHHMWSLLDADQQIPWQDQPIEYHLKFRFHVQDYDAKYHQHVYRTTWGIASPVEYDVPQCSPGTETAKCIHTITGLFDVPKLQSGKDMRLVAAHFHCHAPTCLSVSLYNNNTGELICKEQPVYGQDRGGNPGSGHIEPGPFNEAGYIAVPPCVWGSDEYGLEAPPIVSGQRLYAVKTSNSTYGHHGEMAWLQMLYIQTDRTWATKLAEIAANIWRTVTAALFGPPLVVA